MDSAVMQGFREFVASVAGLVATVVIVVACLVFVFMAYMAWLVECGGMVPFYEGGCSQSENVWMRLGFGITAVVLVVGAVLTVALTIRVLGRWVSPEGERVSLGRHVAVTAALAVGAFILAVGGGVLADALREPSAWGEQNLQAARAAVGSTTTTTLRQTTATVAPTPTPGTTTTTTTTTTTNVALEPSSLPTGVAVLSAHSDGIDLIYGGGSISVLTGVDVSVAWPDFLGGVVFQRVADRPDWEFDNDLDRWVPIWTDSAEASGIEWIPEIGGPAEMLVSGDELSTVSPYRVDTTVIDGAATLVYRRVTGVEHPCADVESEDECMFRTAHGFADQVIALDLETGRGVPLGVADGFDLWSDVSIGGTIAAVIEAEPSSVAMVDVADLAALGTTDHVLRTVSSAWMVYTPEPRCEHQPPERYVSPYVDSGGLVSPDGMTLAVVESHPPCSDGDESSAYIVVINLGSPTDEPGFQLATRLLDPYASIVDYDGSHLLFDSGGGGFLMDRYGTITPLPDCECTYRLWSGPA